MLCTIWLLAFIRQVLAIKLGVFCKAGKTSMPATRKKMTKKNMGGNLNNTGMAKLTRDPTTMMNNAASMANEVTPEGVTFRWQMSKFFCTSIAFLGSALSLSRCSETLQAFSYH